MENIEGIGKEVVESSTPIKEWLVEYVGEQHGPESGEVTIEMVVDTLSKEFPEFLVHIAEENWIRGYHQAMVDIDASEQIIKQLNDSDVEK
jgi:hypothetical protein